ncbi:MAG TPA: RDD family protein [Dokdonella sp.]|uniref:RDD family protein n=1 Tax=Dokdonella sp. TaxID=2291710 RepID=UPI002D8041C5|nr:RDD family protein [Dokdonella sp.]HET9034190.1 RDD family protein [Dokdonella sp.]
MESNKHALVLSGDLLPGFEAADVWKAAAELFRIDQARFDSTVLARAPMTIKESADVAELARRKSALSAIGAQSEVVGLSGGSYFVLIDNTPRGPLPHEFIEQRLRDGRWPAGLKAAPVGSSDWRVFEVAAAQPSLPTPAVAAAAIEADLDAGSVDEADTVAAKIARVADSIAGRKNLLPLPAGDAIHAGFWRRCAAWLIDNLLLFIPSVIVLMIPILGYLIYFAGRWAYFAMMESSPAQATLGKRAMGIIATDGKGRRLSLGQASGRYFAGAISYITLYIGYALAGWTSRKQALHDLIADTCVVFETVRPGEPLPTERPPMPWYGWAANCVLLAVFPIAILAAIAVPAYQDYTMRARLQSTFIATSAVKLGVAESIFSNNTCQGTNPFSDDPLVESIRISGEPPACVITLTLASDSATPAALRGQTIEWQHTADGAWNCISTITPKYLPADCRP